MCSLNVKKVLIHLKLLITEGNATQTTPIGKRSKQIIYKLCMIDVNASSTHNNKHGNQNTDVYRCVVVKITKTAFNSRI